MKILSEELKSNIKLIYIKYFIPMYYVDNIIEESIDSILLNQCDRYDIHNIRQCLSILPPRLALNLLSIIKDLYIEECSMLNDKYIEILTNLNDAIKNELA